MSLLSQTYSWVAIEAATYSASQLDSATVLYFLLHHETTTDHMLKQYPIVERLS